MLTTTDSAFARLGDEVEELSRELAVFAAAHADDLDAVHPEFRRSATNLLHYVALRRRDVRGLQLRLARHGLSSLGRVESHTLATIRDVLRILRALSHAPPPAPLLEDAPAGLTEGGELLAAHTAALLGEPPATRRERIMVTMPSEAASDYTLVRGLLRAGMDCMRVNCGHDDADAWARMAANLRRAQHELGRACRLYMDVAGPKLRTGDLGTLPGVVKIRPERDRHGMVTAPARVLLHPRRTDPGETDADAFVPMPASWLAECQPGAKIRFRDARGSRRTLRVVATAGAARWAVASKTAYVVEGTRLELRTADGTAPLRASVGTVPGAERVLVLEQGDRLVLTRDSQFGVEAVRADDGRCVAPATVPCTLPEVFGRVRVGDRIFFDDGRIGGVIRVAQDDRLELEVTRARRGGERLRSGKGINLPDTDLGLPALTKKDLEDLPLIARHADLVGYSFVRSADGVEELSRRLDELGREDAGLVLKIESRSSFERLPSLLLAVMRRPRAGVMIARGDLAVECGFERLAEIQEEILWICEAAHVPVVWATAVLDTLAKTGAPTRAEITDAAMSERAECVMLNKGPYVLEALGVLDDILHRMDCHQSKKSSLLRRLRSW